VFELKRARKNDRRIYAVYCLKGYARRATETGQVIQREQKERMQASAGFQLHNVDAHRCRHGFLNDRDPVGRCDGE